MACEAAALQTNESIYNLIPRDPARLEKSDKYTSKFKRSVKDETSISKYSHKTMGQAKVPLPTTDQFLKKQQYMRKHYPDGNPKVEENTFKYPDAEQRRPAVPKRDDQPMMGIRTTKNFITTNAVEAIMSVPGKPERNFVDTKKGDKQPLEMSGMHPVFVNKKEYGKAPVYLRKRQEEIRQAQDEYDAYIADYFRRGAMTKLSDEDRAAILDGLKLNWEELHHDYQGLSVVTDTAPKKYRKERLEADMKQLERDIELIEKHGIIYISN